MIVSCPSCEARYKINDSKIKGRGAKITCPRCTHRFVVYKQSGPSKAPAQIPDTINNLDFRDVSIRWTVRKGLGQPEKFFDLATLQALLEDGQVHLWDEISYDLNNWVPIKSLVPLETHFWDVYQKAKKGEIPPTPE
ncbi:MAG: hypothetical protein HN348_05075, partial [Proteobacteria bacterium]|nr:hypothetical protein [Pseudomonadota bacterium]